MKCVRKIKVRSRERERKRERESERKREREREREREIGKISIECLPLHEGMKMTLTTFGF